jgi:hypothetical protein
VAVGFGSRNFRIVNCTFRNFVSVLSNTPVYLNGGETTIDSTSIIGNSNMEYGSIGIYDDAQVTILNSRVINNRAIGFLGGGLMLYAGSGARVYTRNSEFAGNTRINGSDEEKVQIYIMGGEFVYNVPTTTIEPLAGGGLGVIVGGSGVLTPEN